jgi:hypothetical protein
VKRRTKRAEIRAAKKRAGAPSGKSKYGRKDAAHRKGQFGVGSPFSGLVLEEEVEDPDGEEDPDGG